MVSGAYLRRQAEALIAMSRATFDLTIAGRLRRMAAELHTKAAQQDQAEQDERVFTEDEVQAIRPVLSGHRWDA